jgi:hypothetical protein
VAGEPGPAFGTADADRVGRRGDFPRPGRAGGDGRRYAGRMKPYREAKTFTLRIELEATFPDDYEGDDDGGEWLRRWSQTVKPEVVRAALGALVAGGPRYRIVPRSRGKSTDDEIEIGVSFDPSTP